MSQYGDKMTKKAYEYVKKYNLDVTKGTMGWNDEADAFRHAFMQASITTNSNEEIANVLGDGNEILGDVVHNQDPKEKNMDLWNNQIGRQVGEEVKKELEGQNYTKQELEDRIAEKIIERMDNGDLITNPFSDDRSFEQLQKETESYNQENESQNPTLTGRVEYNQPFTREDIAKMSPEEFSKNEDKIMSQMANGEIQNKKYNTQDYQKYTEKEGKIFTREEIGKMSTEEYQKNEPAIMKQLDTVGIPSEKDLGNSRSNEEKDSQNSDKNETKGGSSKSSDNSSGGGSSSEDGNWVTINGNHALLSD